MQNNELEQVEETNEEPNELETLRSTVAELESEKARMQDALKKANAEARDYRLKFRETEREYADASEATKAYERQLASQQERLSNIERQLQESEKNRIITSAISKHGAIAELIEPLVLAKAEYRDGDVFVDGKPVDAHIASLKANERFAGAFLAPTRQGTGSRPGAANGGTQAPALPTKTRSEMTQKEQRQWIQKLGGYQAFKEAVPWDRASAGLWRGKQ